MKNELWVCSDDTPNTQVTAATLDLRFIQMKSQTSNEIFKVLNKVHVRASEARKNDEDKGQQQPTSQHFIADIAESPQN